MGNGIIGKVLYFWVFIIGALFVLRVTGYAGDNKTMAIVLGAIALIYIVWNVARSFGQRKRASKAAANRQPVHAGSSHKKKKRR